MSKSNCFVRNSTCRNGVNFVGTTLGSRNRSSKNVVGIFQNLMTGFVFVIGEMCWSLRIRVLIVEPVTIGRHKCGVSWSDEVDTRDAELSMRRSVAKISVNVT